MPLSGCGAVVCSFALLLSPGSILAHRSSFSTFSRVQFCSATSFQYRFNRRFDMKIILSRLLTALVAAPPSSERVLRAAEVSRKSGSAMRRRWQG
jgi:hypothetical protein